MYFVIILLSLFRCFHIFVGRSTHFVLKIEFWRSTSPQGLILSLNGPIFGVSEQMAQKFVNFRKNLKSKILHKTSTKIVTMTPNLVKNWASYVPGSFFIMLWWPCFFIMLLGQISKNRKSKKSKNRSKTGQNQSDVDET